MKLVLGSGSPRRKELLAGLGFEFTVRTKDTDESFPIEMKCEEVPSFLAQKKATALLPDLLANEIVICADTVVILDNKIIGKPENTAEAIEMLTALNGKEHKVITGVFIGNTDNNSLFSDTTLVKFKEMTANEIVFYVEKFQPFDKAGSYGVQEWWGYVAVERMEGTYTNVMGFPTNLVYEHLTTLKNQLK